VIAAVATALANALTNLSATLLVVPLLAPLGTTAVLAALLGLNIGSGLTYTGSLANLLWRRGLVQLGERPSLREFHRVSLIATPVTLVAAVTALAVVT
jgi:arsenical pump membrane protein